MRASFRIPSLLWVMLLSRTLHFVTGNWLVTADGEWSFLIFILGSSICMGHVVIFSYSEYHYAGAFIVSRPVVHRLLGKSKCCSCTPHCLRLGGRASHLLLFVCVLQSCKCSGAHCLPPLDFLKLLLMRF